jgi:AcrR family transcriptional regulator
MDDMARELMVTKPAIYYHFRNKLDILKHIEDKIVLPMNDILKIDGCHISPKEKLRSIINTKVKYNCGSYGFTLIRFEEMKIFSRRTSKSISKMETEIEYLVRKVLKEGEEQGIFKIDDIKTTSLFILGIVNWVYRWYRLNGKLTPKQIADKAMNFIERALI